MNIPVQRLHPKAILPTRAHDTDAGYDLYALPDEAPAGSSPTWVPSPLGPGQRRLFRTGIKMAIPQGYYGHICDRSGNALKSGLHVLGGICDASYRGDIGVILLNTSNGPVYITEGQRIAQLLIKRHESPTLIEVDSLEDTTRGAGGFGSSGS